MTLRIPKPNLFDKILKKFGKKRAVFIPENAHDKYGQHVYASCQKENFFKALFRPKGSELPEGTIDIYSSQGANRRCL